MYLPLVATPPHAGDKHRNGCIRAVLLDAVHLRLVFRPVLGRTSLSRGKATPQATAPWSESYRQRCSCRAPCRCDPLAQKGRHHRCRENGERTRTYSLRLGSRTLYTAARYDTRSRSSRVSRARARRLMMIIPHFTEYRIENREYVFCSHRHS